MMKMIDGTEFHRTPNGMVLKRGRRELYVIATSVAANKRAEHLVADHSFNSLYRAARPAPGMKNTAYIKLNGEGRRVG